MHKGLLGTTGYTALLGRGLGKPKQRDNALQRETYAITNGFEACETTGGVRPTKRFWGQITNLSYVIIHSGLFLKGRTPKIEHLE